MVDGHYISPMRVSNKSGVCVPKWWGLFPPWRKITKQCALAEAFDVKYKESLLFGIVMRSPFTLDKLEG